MVPIMEWFLVHDYGMVLCFMVSGYGLWYGAMVRGLWSMVVDDDLLKFQFKYSVMNLREKKIYFIFFSGTGVLVLEHAFMLILVTSLIASDAPILLFFQQFSYFHLLHVPNRYKTF